MKRLLVGFVISLIFNSICIAQEIIYDFDIKKGFEIIGMEERPRVIFFLPELKLPLERKDIDLKFLLSENLIKKDVDEYVKFSIEEGKIK